MRILYLDIDTLRPDHLGCYGYHRNTSPHIDRMAAEGIRFDNCYTSDAPCLPSRAALMSGQFGIHNGAVNHSGTAADRRLEGPARGFRDKLYTDSLPGWLVHENNLHTCYIGGFGGRHALWTFYAGFREIHDTGMEGMESAEHVTPAVIDWMEHNAQKDDWFLHVNYWDPHTPYRAPEDFGNPFEDDPLPEWYTQELIDQHMKVPGPHTIQDIGMYSDWSPPDCPRQPGRVKNMEDMRALIDGYDCGIRYMDDHAGQLFRTLEKLGVLDDTVVIISADHGENFGELGIYAEHATADQATCRIPLIIRWPGKTSGTADTGLHYNIDLLPTLAELTGKPARESWDGTSYAPAFEGRDAGRNELILGQFAHGAQRSVRFGDWLYIRTWHDGYHNWPDEMLFNLKDDPREEHNLIADHPDIAQTAREKYERWHAKQTASMPNGAEDPKDTVLRELPCHANTDLSAYCTRLEATGRGDSVAEIKRRHPEMF